MLKILLTPLKTRFLLPATLACIPSLTGCSRGEPVYYDTGSAYIQLKSGVPFVPSRDMTLATESVIQEKDRQIIDLIKVNEQLLRQLNMEE